MQHEVKSQDDMNKIEQHSTDVLIKAIEECEKLKKENRELRDACLRGNRKLCRYGDAKWRQFLKEMAEHATYLTNQFKNGKLPAGEYFVSREGDNNIFLDFLFDDGKFGSYDDIDRVYMAMPTYEEIVTCMFKSHISQI